MLTHACVFIRELSVQALPPHHDIGCWGAALTGIAIARTVGLVPEHHRVVLGSLCKTSLEVKWGRVVNPLASESGELAEEPASCVPDAADAQGRISLAVTGEAFEALLQSGELEQLMSCKGCGASAMVHCVCARIRVFGRFTPQQKIQVVRHFAGAGLTVGMCGDGGNDSGALRAAHAGLSLGGSAEASVAAPFSTDAHSLAALVLLLREGRASLCTSFAAYRFLVVRGIVWTQAKNIMLIMAGLYLAPLVYLYIDLVATSLLVWAITQARPAKTLAPRRPESSLLGPQNVVSSSLSVLLYIVVLLMALALLFSMPWYRPYALEGPIYKWQARSDSFESPLFFIWSAWFSIDLALVLSKGHVHRKPLLHNWALLIIAAALALPVLILLILDETDFNCAFKVNCDKATYLELKSSWVGARSSLRLSFSVSPSRLNTHQHMHTIHRLRSLGIVSHGMTARVILR